MFRLILLHSWAMCQDKLLIVRLSFIDRGPIHKQLMSLKFGSSLCSNLGCDNPIRSLLCMCHNSIVVVACAKSWDDLTFLSSCEQQHVYLYSLSRPICNLFCCIGQYMLMVLCKKDVTAVHYGGLMQERRNSIANALELRLSCTSPPMCYISSVYY